MLHTLSGREANVHGQEGMRLAWVQFRFQVGFSNSVGLPSGLMLGLHVTIVGKPLATHAEVEPDNKDIDGE